MENLILVRKKIRKAFSEIDKIFIRNIKDLPNGIEIKIDEEQAEIGSQIMEILYSLAKSSIMKNVVFQAGDEDGKGGLMIKVLRFTLD